MNIEDATSRPSTAQHRAQSKMPKGGPEAWLADVLAQLRRFREVDLMRLGDGTWSPDGEMVIPAPQSILGTGWLHAHDYDEIALCLKGKVRIALWRSETQTAGSPYVTLTTSRGVLVPAGKFHHVAFARPGKPYALLWLCFPPGLVYITVTGIGTVKRTAATDEPPARTAAATFRRDVEDELGGSAPFRGLRAQALLVSFLVQLVRAIGASGGRPLGSASARRWHQLLVEEARRFLQANFHRSVSLAEAAGRLHLSPHYLSAIFHRECGETFRDHLLRLRVKCARQLLRQTHQPIKAIAVLAGFSDEYYFSRAFKRVVGAPPGAFRRSEQNPKVRGTESIVNPAKKR